MEIKLVTIKDGAVVLYKVVKPTASLDDILEIAECEVNGGYADSAKVLVDGEICAEYEA